MVIASRDETSAPRFRRSRDPELGPRIHTAEVPDPAVVADDRQ